MRLRLKSSVLLTFLILSLFAAVIVPSAKATDLPTRIDANTTWTKTGSPYTLTANLLIAKGVTLTIEPGVTVNLNNYSIYVNGTLRAIGSSQDKIQFNTGIITFTKSAENWNENAGIGSIIQNAKLTTGVYLASSQKIDNCELTSATACSSSIVSNCKINDGLTVADTPTIKQNNIVGDIQVSSDSSAIITGNQISGDIFVPYMTRHTKITYNTINGGIYANAQVDNTEISYNTIVGDVQVSGNTSTISFNTISGGITASAADITIHNNTIKDCSIGIGFAASSYATSIKASITNNKITASNKGIDVPASFIALFYVMHTTASISGNTISNCADTAIFVGGANHAADESPLYNAVKIEDNLLYNNNYAINVAGPYKIEGNTIINNQIGINGGNTVRDNIIANNEVGIQNGVLVENNLITKNRGGLSGCTTIKANTITQNIQAITGQFATANNNNLLGNQQNINYTGTSDADATSNWWGTTETAVINQTIYDYKNDFLLGRVNFLPVLTAANPSAPAADTPIPETPQTSTEPTETAQPTETAVLTDQQPTPTVPEVGSPLITALAMSLVALILLTVKLKKQNNKFSF
jgi:hypothetical protein